MVASRKGACDLFHPSRDHLDLFCEILGKLCLLFPTHQAEHAAKLPKHRQGCIGPDRELQHETLLMPILGQKADAKAHGVARGARVRQLAINTNLATIRLDDSE